MIEFQNERVVSFSLEYQDVYWEIGPTSDDIQEYQFYVQRSEAEAGPWIDIAGPLIDRYYLRDNSFPAISYNRTLFYRIKALHQATGKEIYSKVFDRDGEEPLLAAEIIRTEKVLFEEFVGRKCWLFPRRTFGQRCPSCYDEVLQKRTDESCPTCWGTTFSGGYHYPVAIWAQIDEPERTEQVTVEDHRTVMYYGLRCNPSPDIKPLDLIIDHKNRRFRVVSVSGTSHLGVTVRQEVKLVTIQRGSIEDKIPLQVNAADEALVPSRVFTNPQCLESAEEPLLPSILGPYGY